jgi:N-ethylmaleimide reductase
VHDKGGKIFLQLWHVGRISHSSHQHEGALPVAPSAIRAEGKALTAQWREVDFETPRALTFEEIQKVIDDYGIAAENAKQAGADGVEIHGANGYLLDQFLQDGSNTRTDEYGGSIENRCRLLLEVVDRVIDVWGKGRVGVRLSPFGTFNDMHDSDSVSLFTYVVKKLNERGIAYVHLIESRTTNTDGEDEMIQGAPSVLTLFKPYFQGAVISAGGHTPETAKEALASGAADAVAVLDSAAASETLPPDARLWAGLALTQAGKAPKVALQKLKEKLWRPSLSVPRMLRQQLLLEFV